MAETQNNCPCGSGLLLQSCCLPLIQGKKTAETAEQLLRSRYTAFTRGDVDYIVSSHHPRTREHVKRDEIEEWSRTSEWLGLEILKSEAGGPNDEKGALAIHVRYRSTEAVEEGAVPGEVTDHLELSLFERDEAQWKFVDARPLKTGPIRREEPKIGRNDPCPCGSGKKHKKCCG